MTWRVPNQPNRPGPEWARELLFGTDSTGRTPPRAFGSLLAACAKDAADACARAANEIEQRTSSDSGALDLALGVLRDGAARLGTAGERLDLRDADRAFRVVLMGRTMAGKSTLFEYLSAGNGARVSDGRQRYTRESCLRAAPDIGVEIVDTPGVGAMDGDEDYETAFREVADADLVLWVATDQATQEQTGRALARLSDLGKPIVVALNCLADVTDEIGLLDMLHEPERVFGGDAEGNLAPIRRHLARAGGRYILAVAIHAQAAQVSVSGALAAEEAQLLHHNSRIQSLISTLREQRVRTADQRRVVSMCDFLRVELLNTASSLNDAIVATRAALEASIGSRRDLRKRAHRRVEDAYEELTAAMANAVATRERWIERVDVDQGADKINQQWDKEIAALRTELEQSVTDIGQRLETDLKRIAIDVADDWSEFDPGGLRDLGGRGAIWGNRAVKVGGRLVAGLAGVAVGAKIGALAGTALGPGLGNAIGAGVGAIIGLVSGLLGVNRAFDWLGDKLFRSATEIHEHRRRKVRVQLSPLLDKLQVNLESAAGKVRHDWLNAVESELAKQAAASAAIDQALAVLCHSSDELDGAVASIDLELSRELLRNIGRERTASTATRATRWRGAGIAVQLPEPEFSELILFPTDDIVERIIPTSTHASPAASALQVIRCLTDHEVTIRYQDSENLSVTLTSPLTPGVREAWEALARVHTGIDVRINRPIEGDAP